MKIKEYVDKLNGIEYPLNDCEDLFRQAKEDNIVIVFGQSDDLLELTGAIDDEFSAYDGTKIFLNNNGVIVNKCDDEDCPYFTENIKNAQFNIQAVWSPQYADTTWEILSNIPHLKFNILEDSDIYCIGIIFDMESLKEK